MPHGYEEGSFKLGGWVRRQRTNRKAMSNARRQQLDAIKFNWDPNDDAWEKEFAALKKLPPRKNLWVAGLGGCG